MISGRTLRRLLLSACIAWTMLGAAVARAGELPAIKAHTKLDFSVYKGDRIELEVLATGNGIEAKWMTADGTVCRKLACDVATDDWALGSQILTFVVFNERGSLFLKYRIRILPAPGGYKTGRVKPEMVTIDAGLEEPAAEDLVVRTVAGRGFSYDSDKVQVVGPRPRVLQWGESLRTQKASTMQFGRGDVEMHALGGASSVALAKGESGRRVIALKSGAVRSRQLDGREPRWSVLVGDWLQVDTDALGDVLVEALKDDDGVVVTVLRGQARVFRRKPGSNADAAAIGEAVGIPTGVEAHFTKLGDEPVRLVQPDAKRVGKRVQETSPSYLPGHRVADEDKGSALLRDTRVPSLAIALGLAREAIASQDYFVAIEALQQHPAQLGESFEGNLLAGEAYAGVHLTEAAVAHLKKAVELDPDAAVPRYLTGRAYLAARHWKKAQKAFEEAVDRDFDRPQELYYYAGVAALNAGDRIQAKSHFTRSLWDARDEKLAESARAFLGETTHASWLEVSLGLGMVYDTNPLRLSEDAKELLKDEIGTDGGLGYVGAAGFGIFPWRGRGGELGGGFEAEKLGWLDSSLSDVGLLRQKLWLRSGLAFGGGETKPAAFGVRLETYAEVHHVGEERANDALGGDLALGSPALMNLTARIESRINIDPLPARQDYYDPIVEEVVAAGDRSSRQLHYGLELEPVRGDNWELGLGIRAGETIYRLEEQKTESFEDAKIAVSAGYKSGLRSRFGLGLEQTAKTFAESEDDRKDTKTKLGLDWTWRVTPALRQVLDVTHEAQASNVEFYTYAREALSLRWCLDF